MSTQSHGHRYMTGDEVRAAFVQFFEERGHREVPSSSLVPHNDPTVLLTTAGMQQMTPYFLGLEQPPAPRMVSVQKCFRTVDIDEVGDESHCTFFFMLGNFSVGDYFKRESLRLVLGVPDRDAGSPGRSPLPDRPPRRRGRLRASGATRSACRRSGSASSRRQLVGSGRRRPGRTVPTPRSTSTAARSTADDRPTARPAATARATSRSGTTSSWSSSRRPDGSPHAAAAAARRHRHGAGAAGDGHAGRRARSTTPTSTRRSSSARPALAGVTLRRRRGDRPRAARHRRPRPRRDVPDRRRRPARQRGPLLRPAPHPAPRDPPRPQARSRASRSWPRWPGS